MTVLDWRTHSIGPLRPCVLCGRLALMRDATGKPCHKTCAEQHLDTGNILTREGVAA
jgi:hypothetical protein